MRNATVSEATPPADASAPEEQQEAQPFSPPPDAGLVVKQSAHNVDDTLLRLEKLIAKKGLFEVVARIDHQRRATEAGMWLADMEVLIFGTVKLDTALMQAAPTIGMDLPLRILVWEDDTKQVWLAYNDMMVLAHRHGVQNLDPLFAKLSESLNRLTDVASKATHKPSPAVPAPMTENEGVSE
jgi:uncharacterized protein (DUF302 family)